MQRKRVFLKPKKRRCMVSRFGLRRKRPWRWVQGGPSWQIRNQALQSKRRAARRCHNAVHWCGGIACEENACEALPTEPRWGRRCATGTRRTNASVDRPIHVDRPATTGKPRSLSTRARQYGIKAYLSYGMSLFVVVCVCEEVRAIYPRMLRSRSRDARSFFFFSLSPISTRLPDVPET
jgi:hypothetical protein